MATERQRPAARRAIKKTHTRGTMSSGRRAKPGSTGRGNYYHVEVGPKTEFLTFRTQDVGDPGHIQRVAGQRPGGSWATVKWLVSKEDAHVSGDRLVPDTKDARKLFGELGSKPLLIKGDRFEAKPRPNVPERAKPTPAQRRARRENIGKAQAARRRK